MNNYTTRENCRVCAGKLEDILSLGNQHLVGFTYPTSTSVEGYSHVEEKPVYVPLDLVLCTECKLLQLKHTTDPKLLWNDNYGYRSGVNKTMREELLNVVASTIAQKRLEDGDIVVDIGSNDGTLLSSYTNPKLIKVGYEPSSNVVSLPNGSMEKSKIYVDFFSKKPFLSDFNEKAKIVTCVAMFYDLEDPNQFIKDIEAILDPEGIFVIQQNYLVGMLEQNAFDNIVHEHLEYYCLLSLENLLKRHNLEVFDISENDINGGSFRTYICFKGTRQIKDSVEFYREKEKVSKLDQKDIYLKFAKKVKESAEKLGIFIRNRVHEGKTICLYGASTRSGTMLQSSSLDSRFIKFAAERNPFKWGRKCVGTNIPIISEEEARKIKPDFMLIGPWFFLSEFLSREKEYLKNGGKFIVPLPEFKIIDYDIQLERK